MLRNWLVAGLALSVAACGGGGDGYSSASAPQEAAMAMAPPPPMAEMKMAADASFSSSVVEEQGGGGGGQPVAPADSRQIAYTYFYGFAVPTGNLEALLNAHKAACEQAGPSKCYVVGSTISGLGQDYANGSLELRGAADWVTGFKASMDDSLKPFGATLDGSNTTSEDLTIQLIDTTARLTSAKTLRVRLQDLLKDRPGKLGDLLEIERELARVQAEIDSTESILAAMRLRVAMSALTLNYQPKYSAVSESIWRPLGEAFGGFVPSIVGSLAAVVGFTAVALPWLLIVAGLVWFAVWLVRWVRRRPRKGAMTAASAPAASPGGPRPV